MIPPIDVSRNHPPMIATVFDSEYLSAEQQVFARTPPSRILNGHRWMGTDTDRAAGARFAALRLGSEPSSERVVVTNGTQSALLMIMATAVGKGGVLLTEDMTYPPIFTFARHFGFRVVGVPIDDEGIIPEALTEAIKRERPRALYCVPTFQNPTTSIMPLARREAIARIAREHAVTLIEDDIYSLIEPTAPPPISALAPELSWYVLGTAKAIAAGIKVAYAVAPSEAAATKHFWPGVRGTHWMVTPISAAVMTALVESGGAARIVTSVGEEVAARQAIAADHLRGIDVTTRDHALHIFVPLPDHMNRHQLADAARRHGLVIGTSDQFAAVQDRAPNAVRIGIGNPATRDQLVEALGRFVAAYREIS